MLSKVLVFSLAAMVALFCLAEAGGDENPQKQAEAIRMLQELDRLYSQAGRSRIDRRDGAEGERVDRDVLDHAVRLLQLHNLDRLYSYQSRPRYGKRNTYQNWARDLEEQPDWLQYARRR